MVAFATAGGTQVIPVKTNGNLGCKFEFMMGCYFPQKPAPVSIYCLFKIFQYQM